MLKIFQTHFTKKLLHNQIQRFSTEIVGKKYQHKEIDNKKIFNIDRLDKGQQDNYLQNLSLKIAKNLQNRGGYKVLQNISPLSLTKLADSPYIEDLSNQQIMFLALYLKKKKYLTKIDDTILYEKIKNICINNANQLDPSEISTLVNILQTFKIKDESLYKMIQFYIQQNVKNYNNRCLSNIVINFCYISRLSQGYNSFYEFLKEPICQKLITQPCTSKDLQGYVKAYSKTYNLTENFMKVLEEQILLKFKNGNFEDEDLFPIAHSYYLNKNIYESQRIFDLVENVLQQRFSSIQLSNTLIGLKILMDQKRMTEQMFQELRTKIYDHDRNLNSYDIEQLYNIYFSYIDQNKEKYLQENIIHQNKILQQIKNPYKKDVQQLCKIANILFKNFEFQNVKTFLHHLNYIIDDEQQQSRQLLKNIKDFLKYQIKKKKLTSIQKENLFMIIDKIQNKKQQMVFKEIIK